jgi:hypothetical protein
MFFKRQHGSSQPITLGETPEGCRLLTEEELQCVSGGAYPLKEVKKTDFSVSFSAKKGKNCMIINSSLHANIQIPLGTISGKTADQVEICIDDPHLTLGKIEADLERAGIQFTIETIEPIVVVP